MLARCAVGGAFVTRIAAATDPAFKKQFGLAFLGEVKQHMLLVFGQDLRPHRDFDYQIITARTGAVFACTTFTARRLEMLGIAKIDQRIQSLDRLEDDITTFTAITAIRTAMRDIFLSPETDSTRPALTRADIDFGLIQEMHAGAFREGGRGKLGLMVKR